MLTALIITQFVLWLLGFFVGGVSLYQLLVIITPICFAMRKFGIKVGYGTLITIELILLFFSTTFTVMFSSIVWGRFIIKLLIRVIAIIIAIIDDTMYVYVTEERKKQ